MAAKPKIVRPEDEDDDDGEFSGIRNRFRATWDKWKFRIDIAGPVLDRPGALLGIGMIVASIAAVVLLVGDKIGRAFRWW